MGIGRAPAQGRPPPKRGGPRRLPAERRLPFGTEFWCGPKAEARGGLSVRAGYSTLRWGDRQAWPRGAAAHHRWRYGCRARTARGIAAPAGGSVLEGDARRRGDGRADDEGARRPGPPSSTGRDAPSVGVSAPEGKSGRSYSGVGRRRAEAPPSRRAATARPGADSRAAPRGVRRRQWRRGCTVVERARRSTMRGAKTARGRR